MDSFSSILCAFSANNYLALSKKISAFLTKQTYCGMVFSTIPTD